MGRKLWVLPVLAATFLVAVTAYAQQPPASPQQQTAPSGPTMPDAFKLNLLIRSAIIALNQANKTGNYTVLQDLSAPAFRAANDSTRLAQIFANLRARNLDLTPVLFFTPKLVQQPQFNQQGILRLAGYFPTDPERVNFDLYFQLDNGDWKIFGIGVSLAPNDQTAALPAQPDKASPTGPPQAAGPPKAVTGESSKGQQRAVAKKDAAPPRKQKQAAPDGTGVENRTTPNAVRIDLGDQWRASSEPQNGNAPKQ